MIKRLLSAALLCILIFFGTYEVQAKRRKRYNCAEKINKAVTRFQKKRYNEVKTILDEVKLNCSGHSAMDTALYYLGRAYLGTRQPIPASLEFEVLIQDFPNSSFNEEAHFLLGLCSYKESSSYERDQVKTRDAVRQFIDFIDIYPESPFVDSAKHYLKECREKLVKKEFMNARFYEKVDQFDAAIVYYKIIIEEFPQSLYVAECQFSLARNLVKVSRPKEAAGVLNELLSSDADEEIKKKAQLLLSRIEKSGDIKPPDTKPDSTAKENSSL